MTDKINTTTCFLKRAEFADIDILFEWANDSETRRNSFNQHMISREEHEMWFYRMMNDPSRIQYLMMSADKPVGQIRIDISDNVGLISYSIAPNERGKGYGKQIIELAKNMIREEHPVILELRAKVKADNMASIRCFEENGFIKEHILYKIDTVSVTGRTI